MFLDYSNENAKEKEIRGRRMRKLTGVIRALVKGFGHFDGVEIKKLCISYKKIQN